MMYAKKIPGITWKYTIVDCVIDSDDAEYQE
jgi:hypothetical protein